MRAVRPEAPAHGVIEEAAPTNPRSDPRVDPASIPAMRAVAPSDAPAEPAPEESAPAAVDPRFAEIDRLLARSAWKEIVERLGPPDKAAELPPSLGLIYALARREAAGDASAAGATELAMSSMAALLGVAPSSEAALVLTKRLLRQNPWRSRPTPTKLSVPLIVLGLVVGAAVGWFVSLGSIKLF